MRLRDVSILAFALTALVIGGCAEDEGTAGSECESTEGCKAELVCEDNGSGKNTCQRPFGATCDPDAEKPHCLFGSECQADPDAGEDDPGGRCYITEGVSCAEAPEACAPELTCAEIQSGDSSCFKPVLMQGSVFDSTSGDAIEGAHVIALNDLKAAVSDVAITDAEGSFTLEVPVVRDAEGNPVDTAFTLRAAAQDYQTFPGGLRTALPISTSVAAEAEEGYVIESALTEIALIPLPSDQQGLPFISGRVLSDDLAAGVLVVAESSPTTGISAVTDLDGDFTIFNVPDASYTVKGYRAGLQLNPVDVSVSGESVTDVELSTSSDSLSTVSGSVQIVNAPGGLTTSIILVVESTFDPTFIRGETPAGLRAPESGPPTIEGAWTISGVPAGRYVILAAFENDDLVRDPDEGIGGTELVTIEVGNEDLTVDQSFKVTEHLEIFSPGADRPEGVTSSPDLVWADDSSEDGYEIEVFNAYGDMVWSTTHPEESGVDQVVEPYAGPLETGMYYQFRVRSTRRDSYISTTEDLRGVFFGQ